MIEMLGVLAIIGVLSVGGIAGYSKAMMKFKINKTIDQISMTVTNIRTLYAQQANYDGLSHELAYKMGLIDDAMKTADSKGITSPFGAVTITTGPSGTDANGAFLITFEDLPREACVAIATNDWGSNYSSGLLGIGVNATPAELDGCTIGVANSTTATNKVVCAGNNRMAAMTVAQAANNCGASGSVTFKYY